jgi:hypothetical protein
MYDWLRQVCDLMPWSSAENAPQPYTSAPPFASTTSAPWSAPLGSLAPERAPSGIEICERPMDVPVMRSLGDLGLNHWWFRTPSVEMGLGPAGGGVPGEQSSIDYPGMPTSLNDHTGQYAAPGSVCTPLEQRFHMTADVACVEEHLKEGQCMGRWLPPANDCHTAVFDILSACRIWGEEPAQITDPDPMYRYLGGAGAGGGQP